MMQEGSQTTDSFEMFDVEKDAPAFKNPEKVLVETNSEEQFSVEESDKIPKTKLSFLNDLAGRLNAETKGIDPVTDEEKNDPSILNATTMWFSANLVLSAYAIGGLGPLVFDLNFGTCVLTIIFFNILGLLPVAFFSLFGAELGMRQMVLSRFLVGNVTGRIFSLFNCIACIGWCVLNSVCAAQLLNMVNQGPHKCPLWAGVLIVVSGTVIITFFGHKVIHLYEKWSWIPNFAIFLVIIARLHLSGNFSGGEWTSGPTTAGSVLSFGSAVFGFATGWTTYAADYTVYMP